MRAKKTDTADQRFDAAPKSIDESGCLLWLGRTDSKGYGVFWMRTGHRSGRHLLAHRFSLMRASGISDTRLFACHRCDVPNCVTPEHLFWASQKENMQDAKTKGRIRNGPFGRGDQHPSQTDPSSVLRGTMAPGAVLTEQDVAEIYQWRLAGATLKEIAARYPVYWTSVRLIVTGKSWGHLLGVNGNPTLEQLSAVGRAKAGSSLILSPHP